MCHQIKTNKMYERDYKNSEDRVKKQNVVISYFSEFGVL